MKQNTVNDIVKSATQLYFLQEKKDLFSQYTMIEDWKDIYDQIFAVNVLLTETNAPRYASDIYYIHYLNAYNILFSHLIDDYFDVFINHKQKRKELEKILVSYHEQNELQLHAKSTFEKLITIMLDEKKYSEVKKDFFSKYAELLKWICMVDCDNENYYYFSNLRMIVAGMAQTAHHFDIIDVKLFFEIFNRITECMMGKNSWVLNFENTFVKRCINSMPLINVKASALLEMFLCSVYKIDEVVMEQIELSNIITGMYVHLNNVMNEDIKYVDNGQYPKSVDYVTYIAGAWDRFISLKDVDMNLFTLQLNQLCIILNRDKNVLRAHNLDNLESKKELIDFYQLIYNKASKKYAELIQ